ncbi:MAG TPA: bifunctional demethylmenaquinone methyltransferase/2-methoxy-6-polyprenyl-1,4-benzoquinol methylase UbiE [Armatimonadetes bacterium]|nr:bifunctional demethylmenaquinone methyltransferase/2-methoxy-6-polyprenyl-1,4-benzoquinol methylase UbiE [Armatimonadota bacterium]
MKDEKAGQVRSLFAQIAPRYDLLNAVLSVNLHRRWRPFAVRKAALRPGDWAVDVATGTGDFAWELLRAVGPRGRVVGVDFCAPMVVLGRRKARQRGVEGKIRFVLGQAEDLPFAEDTFDCATLGFALRNVSSVERTLAEMARVVKPGGRVVNLELTRPPGRWWGWMYRWYLHRFVPLIGGLLSGKPEAYAYLSQSIQNFLSPEQVAEQMEAVGLEHIHIYPLAGGVATLHLGVKRGGG